MKAVCALKGVPQGTDFPSGGPAPKYVLVQTGKCELKLGLIVENNFILRLWGKRKSIKYRCCR